MKNGGGNLSFQGMFLKNASVVISWNPTYSVKALLTHGME